MSKFKGEILIYIDGFTVEEWRCWGHNNPDSFFIAESGWAVGDNSRDRPCSRASHDKIRRFNDYDEVTSFIFRKQRKHKNWRFRLIYDVEGSINEISSLEDILAIDAQMEKLAAEEELARTIWRDQHMPEFDRLNEKYGLRLGTQLAMFLGECRLKGIEATKLEQGKSRYYRLIKFLQAAGVNVT
jgi:hypothetical protein